MRRYKSLLFGIRHYANASCSSLNRIPNLQQTSLAILSPLMIPEPKCFDALFHQKFFARSITFHSIRQAMLKTVEFDVQFGVGAVKIQNAIANGVLPTKFETSET